MIDIVFISAASGSGKSLLLERLGELESLAHFRTYEPDEIRYWDPRAHADVTSTHTNLAALLSTGGPAGVALANDIDRSDGAVRLIKHKFLELALEPQPTITVLPKLLRSDRQSGEFLRLLSRYAALNIRHVLVSPEWSR